MFYVYDKLWDTLLCGISNHQSIRLFDDRKQQRYFMVVLYVHMCGTGNTELLFNIGNVTDRSYLVQQHNFLFVSDDWAAQS